MSVNALKCYLEREDGEWFELGERRGIGVALACFDGSADGKTYLRREDTRLLALRIQGDFPTYKRAHEVAQDIIEWSMDLRSSFLRWVRFRTELDFASDDLVPKTFTGSCGPRFGTSCVRDGASEPCLACDECWTYG